MRFASNEEAFINYVRLVEGRMGQQSFMYNVKFLGKTQEKSYIRVGWGIKLRELALTNS